MTCPMSYEAFVGKHNHWEQTSQIDVNGITGFK